MLALFRALSNALYLLWIHSLVDITHYIASVNMLMTHKYTFTQTSSELKIYIEVLTSRMQAAGGSPPLLLYHVEYVASRGRGWEPETVPDLSAASTASDNLHFFSHFIHLSKSHSST